MTLEVIAPGVPVRQLERVVCVRVPDTAPPLLALCRCACCGRLRKVSMHGGQYAIGQDSEGQVPVGRVVV
jgi:hypothetical protein